VFSEVSLSALIKGEEGKNVTTQKKRGFTARKEEKKDSLMGK